MTKEALVELIKEITDIAGPRPVTDAELAFAKDRLVRGFPNQFETTFGVAGTLADLVLYDLPDDYFATYQSEIEAVTKADVDRVARKYLDPTTWSSSSSATGRRSSPLRRCHTPRSSTPSIPRAIRCPPAGGDGGEFPLTSTWARSQLCTSLRHQRKVPSLQLSRGGRAGVRGFG